MVKTKFVCSSCGYESGKWYGKCPECGTWNSFQETEVLPKNVKRQSLRLGTSTVPQKIGSVKSVQEERISTGFEEFDRVLGGREHYVGIVPGSVTLLSGDPGIGKSTLLLQLALNLSRGPVAQKFTKPTPVKAGELPSVRSSRATPRIVLYITGEESETQVKMRAERIAQNLSNHTLLILSLTDVDVASEIIKKTKPDLVIIDSVQTMATTEHTGFPGSIPQIRYVTAELVSIAKTLTIPVFMVGHVTKEGIVAGPQLLSHMVDTVLYLEGDALTGTRILRSFKNRFGDTSEVGIFIMEERGLIQIKDAADFFLNKKDASVPGSCIAVIMEGSRPILVEVQALVVPTTFAYPRRIASGLSEKRLELLLAVIQKHAKIPVERMDVFLNVVGGLKVSETGADIAACLAIVSSYKNKPLSTAAAIGEVGLLGELKTVVNLDKRIREAQKFGYTHVTTVKDGAFLKDAIGKIV